MDKKPAKPAAPAKPPEHIEVFYDVRDGAYWYQVNGRYLALKKGDLFDDITAKHSITHKDQWFNGLSPLDWITYNARQSRQIDYAGSLGGHKVGAFKDNSGRQFLVIDQPKGIWDALPKKVETPEFFETFVAELLPGEQASYFFYWLAIALASLRNGDFAPGQVVVLAGPVECGKSLLQYIITEVLGGRAGLPMRYMMEETPFNKDFAGTEHWMIEEPKTTTDTRTRVQFGNAIKECFNNRDFSVHAKGKEAITLPIFRRGSISVNDEPELLQVLPPLNGSVDDKMMLFHCSRVTAAFDPFRDDSGKLIRSKLWQAVLSETPAIRAWLLKNFRKVPKPWRNDRFGIAAYHHPDLRERLVSFTQEARLLNILDEILFSGEPPHTVKAGRAMELEREFLKGEFGFELQKMLRYPGQFASLLGKLAKIEPQRVTKRTNDGYATWEIHPPSQPTK